MRLASASGARGGALDSKTLALAALLKMPVDRGARDVEDVRNLLDGALTGVVELLREDDLLRVEPRSTSTAGSVPVSSTHSPAPPPGSAI